MTFCRVCGHARIDHAWECCMKNGCECAGFRPAPRVDPAVEDPEVAEAMRILGLDWDRLVAFELAMMGPVAAIWEPIGYWDVYRGYLQSDPQYLRESLERYLRARLVLAWQARR